MKISHAHSVQPENRSLSSFVRHLARRWFGKDEPARPAIYIKVWDAQQSCYRSVDLNNQNDPLWSIAYSIAGVQRHDRQNKRKAA